MKDETNLTATASLVCGISLLVCWMGGMCLSFVPFVGVVAIFLVPVEWLLAVGALVTGVAGYTMSRRMEGRGATAAITGAVIAGSWLLFQLLVWASVFLILAGTVMLGLVVAVVGFVSGS